MQMKIMETIRQVTKVETRGVLERKVLLVESVLSQGIRVNVKDAQGIIFRFVDANNYLIQLYSKISMVKVIIYPIKHFRSRSKDRRSRRRSSRSKSRDRRRRSKSKEKSSSKKSSRHRSRSKDKERSEKKRGRSKERNRESRRSRSKEGRSQRDRTPEHMSDSRVTRDYDQEEAGFESCGDMKVK